MALARKKGHVLVNDIYLGEIVVTSQSASLLSILDLSSDNVITCPKLKLALLKAKVNEPVGSQKEAMKNASPGGHKLSPGFASPFLLFARNRLHLRRTTDSDWMADSLHGSSKIDSSVNIRRQLRRSNETGGSGSLKSSSMKSRSAVTRRGATNLIDRKRSNSSLNFLQGKSSFLSSVYASRESEIESERSVS